FGNQCRFDGEIGMKLPAESAAKEWKVDFDLFLRDLERGSERLRGSGWMLDGRPEFTGVALHICRCVERLHGSMSNERNFVHGLDFLRCSVEGLVHVAVVPNLLRGFALRELTHLGAQGSRTDRRSRSVLPFDDERV